MKKGYLVWNLTNYGDGFEILGVYRRKADAEKDYKTLMKTLYGTTNEDKLLELWEHSDTCCSDSWRITPITIKD